MRQLIHLPIQVNKNSLSFDKEKTEAEESKVIYKKRKLVVEPVFGQIKSSGFRNFSVRGKEKVAGEFSLICAAHNIKKITNIVDPNI